MKNEHNKKSNPKKPLNKALQLSGAGLQMFAIIAIGTYIGLKLDEKFPNKNKLFSVLLSLTSVILAIFIVIRSIIVASKEDENES
jgi:F0F1-type ATP synthase assembly protein I